MRMEGSTNAPVLPVLRCHSRYYRTLTLLPDALPKLLVQHMVLAPYGDLPLVLDFVFLQVQGSGGTGTVPLPLLASTLHYYYSSLLLLVLLLLILLLLLHDRILS